MDVATILSTVRFGFGDFPFPTKLPSWAIITCVVTGCLGVCVVGAVYTLCCRVEQIRSKKAYRSLPTVEENSAGAPVPDHALTDFPSIANSETILRDVRHDLATNDQPTAPLLLEPDMNVAQPRDEYQWVPKIRTVMATVPQVVWKPMNQNHMAWKPMTQQHPQAFPSSPLQTVTFAPLSPYANGFSPVAPSLMAQTQSFAYPPQSPQSPVPNMQSSFSSPVLISRPPHM